MGETHPKYQRNPSASPGAGHIRRPPRLLLENCDRVAARIYVPRARWAICARPQTETFCAIQLSFDSVSMAHETSKKTIEAGRVKWPCAEPWRELTQQG